MTDAPDQPGLIVGQGPDGELYVLDAAPEALKAKAAQADEDTAAITEPAKVMRIGRMISRLLDEVKDAPLDDASRARLREIYTQSIDELAGGLDQELAGELRRITAPFADDSSPSDAELRIAQAQLVGWLEGLFQGLQTALVAQQMVARAQVEQMRKQLGKGDAPTLLSGPDAAPTVTPPHGAGLYL
ncbi:MAG: bacterial proteasome activator family protein [Propionibacteriaceae bacterium]|jgi:hypothetical protein|nr:bacterial proteasome activator family protein [Propionibacteriaceae bacterium]